MSKKKLITYGIPLLLIIALLGYGLVRLIQYNIQQANPLETAFQQVASDTQVPAALLKAVAYTETRFDMHRTGPMEGPGTYGIMNLLSKEEGVSPLGRAARELGVSELKIKTDAATNIRAGAVILKDNALQLSTRKTLPPSLNGWRGAVALYGVSQSRYVVNLYVAQVYQALHDGFKVQALSGEMIELAPQPVTTQPLTTSEMPPTLATLPAGCTLDNKVDYPGAVDCVLNPDQHDCMKVPGTNTPCSYFPDRPKNASITYVVIHDIEGNAPRALAAFQDPKSMAVTHYIVGTDGTVYQVVREKDTAFHAANLWYNQRAIGIEHEGYGTSGSIWYTPATYQASAKLTAYLAKKYHIPLEHDRIVSHGTVQGSSLAKVPNHVDPGMYWQWDYYLNQVHQQGVAYSQEPPARNTISLHLPANASTSKVNFFYLYNSPRIDPHNLIPQSSSKSDVTDEANNVEASVSYYYLDKQPDQNGSGTMMYQIWYGESLDAQSKPPKQFMHARLAWLAVPPGVARDGQGTPVKLHSSDGKPVQISGSPRNNTSTADYHIGDAPDGAIFVSAYSTPGDKPGDRWYEINYNHRQAWVPSSAIQVIH